MAERWELIVDFKPYAGKKIVIKNARDVMADEDYNATDRVLQFRVGMTVTSWSNNGPLPAELSKAPLPKPKSGVDRSFKFERSSGEWRINGVPFSSVKNRILARPTRGMTEVWELENSSGGWSHPVHIHLIDFQIISRTGGRNAIQPYEAVALKDVVLLGTNEKVRVLARYAPWDGVYMFHWHNLVHEDHDMMAAFNVTQLVDFGYPETTKFIDPMEERWRDKPYDDKAKDLKIVKSETLPFFSSLDAYAHVGQINDALDQYFLAKSSSTPTSSTKTSTSTTKTSTSSAKSSTTKS
ncbi:uncharacterized protein LAJ45_00680 [Morchella importuna]|uniref:uncharacterized protein n=1 Tax=Morchella importuna TaxID=1174673 RepID=UPI001E8E65D5|nr:uncharacterized protein LAJ45_00680 [Morchella importuna]KAH8155670.1 hypothetical protein LAJ45_00680 [Morchella importuna]